LKLVGFVLFPHRIEKWSALDFVLIVQETLLMRHLNSCALATNGLQRAIPGK
jgi:hypothetical protein